MSSPQPHSVLFIVPGGLSDSEVLGMCRKLEGFVGLTRRFLYLFAQFRDPGTAAAASRALVDQGVRARIDKFNGRHPSADRLPAPVSVSVPPAPEVSSAAGSVGTAGGETTPAQLSGSRSRSNGRTVHHGHRHHHHHHQRSRSRSASPSSSRSPSPPRHRHRHGENSVRATNPPTAAQPQPLPPPLVPPPPPQPQQQQQVTLRVWDLPRETTEREMSLLFRERQGFLRLRMIAGGGGSSGVGDGGDPCPNGKAYVLAEFAEIVSAAKAITDLYGIRLDPASPPLAMDLLPRSNRSTPSAAPSVYQ